MGNCWGSKEQPTTPSRPEMSNLWGSEEQQISPSTLPAPDAKLKIWKAAPVPAPLLTKVVVPEDKVVAKDNGGGGEGSTSTSTPRSPSTAIGEIIRPQLKQFAYTDLKRATKNFRPDSVVGEGGFGRVYKGWIDEYTMAPSKVGVGIPVAVKRCSPDSCQGLKEWKAEIDFLGKFSHPNLVKLIGCCWEDKELLLVYEYMQKGSLENHLFRKNVDPPSWSKRIRIARDAARGLDFLHTSANTVIYRDFKAANILLDENYGAKLSDFGLARRGPPIDQSHVTTQAVGTYGYAAPEYVNTGHLYVASDVYGFGVVLLEILTGLKAYDKTRLPREVNLADWHKPKLHSNSKLKNIIDPRMKDYPPEAVNKLAQLILKCLQDDPKNRPRMSEVLLHLDIISTIRSSPKGSKPSSSNSVTHGHRKKPINAHSHHPSPIRDYSKRAPPHPHKYTTHP